MRLVAMIASVLVVVSVGLFRGAPGLCSSDPGFDRPAFHTTFNADVVGFFLATLHLESH